MAIRDKIKERLSVSAKSFHIDEWDEDIYCTPISCGEMSKLQKRHPSFLTNMDGEAMVDLILSKALDSNGDKLFTLEDKPYLLREEMTVISSVAVGILGSQTSEDHEKN